MPFFIICTDQLLSHCLKMHAAEMSDSSLMWMSTLQTHINKIQTFWTTCPDVEESQQSQLSQRDVFGSAPGAFDVTDTCLATGDYVLGLPLRYLPHRRISDLYWLFIAVYENSYAMHLPPGSPIP